MAAPPHPQLHVVMAVANNPYPQDVRVRNEARTLVAAGHDVRVIAPRAPGQPRRETVDDVQVLRYPAPPTVGGRRGYALEFAYVTFATALYVLAEMARRPLDVLHLHNPPDTLFMAALLPRLLGAKVVFDHHDLAPELYRAKFAPADGAPGPAGGEHVPAGGSAGGGALLEWALRALERASCRLAHRVVSANESYRQMAILRDGVPAERVVVVRNGPPLARLEVVAPDPEVRGRAPFMIGYLGRISRQDGVDHLVRALYHLEADHGVRDWAAVVVGSADEPEALRSLARELGILGRIDFTGWQDEPTWRRTLAAVDVCVVPDPINGINEHSTMIKTMDYMALGKPVVAYDLHEHRVSAGEAALYADPNDPAALAARLAELHADPCLRRRLGEAGRARVRQGLSWEHSAERLVALYQTARSW